MTNEPTTRKSLTPNLDKAVFLVQQEIDIIAKKEVAKIEGNKSNFTYKYAGMPAIWEELKPLLKKHELLVRQPTTSSDGKMSGQYLRTVITHIPSSEYDSFFSQLVIRRDDPQSMGAATTFAKRYQLGNYFGLITEDDDDAAKSRLATADQKKDWVRAFTVMRKKKDPEASPTYNEFSKFVMEVYGKGISDILAKDSQSVLDTINAFSE